MQKTAELVEFNLNQYVRVKLTPEGKLILRRQHDALNSRAGGKLGKYKPRATDAKGRTRFQLWELMQDFGPHIDLGGIPPFGTDIWLEPKSKRSRPFSSPALRGMVRSQEA